MVEELDDDDPILRSVDGTIVDTWRESYPYDERMPNSEYEGEKRLLQIELVKMQNWMKDTGARQVILFEGRDAAGKGGTIKRFMEHLNPRHALVVALEKPTEPRGPAVVLPALHPAPSGRRKHHPVRPVLVHPGRGRAGDGLLHQRAVRHVPPPGAAVRGPAGRRGVPADQVLVLGVPGEQSTRFLIRQIDPVRQWKLSPTDLASLDKWEAYTRAKEDMFLHTDTPEAPWTVIKSNDKKRARLGAMRHVLSTVEYEGKDREIVGQPDPKIVGRAADLFEVGEGLTNSVS